jgi:hypothetical protein
MLSEIFNSDHDKNWKSDPQHLMPDIGSGSGTKPIMTTVLGLYEKCLFWMIDRFDAGNVPVL